MNQLHKTVSSRSQKKKKKLYTMKKNQYHQANLEKGFDKKMVISGKVNLNKEKKILLSENRSKR